MIDEEEKSYFIQTILSVSGLANKKTYNYAEVIAALGVTRRTFSRMVGDGRLKTQTVVWKGMTRQVVSREELMRYFSPMDETSIE